MADAIDLLLTSDRIATMDGKALYGLVENGAIGITGEKIVWTGPAVDAPPAAQHVELGDRLITPGLIDCHTHLVFGGNRAREFEMRLEGATYEEVARAGGGIVSTVKATRDAGEEELLRSASDRLSAMIGEGVTTVEIKSGYGLDRDTELRMQLDRKAEFACLVEDPRNLFR